MEIWRIRRVIAACATSCSPRLRVQLLRLLSSSRTVARSRTSATAEGSVPAPSSASRSSRWVSGSVLVNGARRQVIRKPCRTSSVSMPVTAGRSAPKVSASLSARAPNRTGATAASWAAWTAPVYRTWTRPGPHGASSRLPRRTARVLNATSRRSSRSGYASNRSITAASHCVSTRATGRCPQPHRTRAVRPSRMGATPANRPNGVGRPSARSRYPAVATVARLICLGSTGWPAQIVSTR